MLAELAVVVPGAAPMACPCLAFRLVACRCPVCQWGECLSYPSVAYSFPFRSVVCRLAAASRAVVCRHRARPFHSALVACNRLAV